MSGTLKDLMDRSFEIHADRTAVRILRQADQQGDKGLRYVPVSYKQLRDQRNRLASGFARSGLTRGRFGVYPCFSGMRYSRIVYRSAVQQTAR